MTTPPVQASGLEPGVPGFSFADLQEPRRLKDLHDGFCRQVARDDPALWSGVGGVSRRSRRAAPGGCRVRRCSSRWRRTSAASSPGCSASRPSARRCRRHARHDQLFRFKVDFVRRRALPLRKSGAPASPPPPRPRRTRRAWWPATAERRRRRCRAAPRPSCASMRSRAGCALLDREAALPKDAAGPSARRFSRSSTAVARWAAAHLDDPACAGWVSFRLPAPARRRSTSSRWSGPIRRCPELAVGPERQPAPPRRLRADRPRAWTGARS